jgi:glycosyltransferase involved in cell wall biosynthesis
MHRAGIETWLMSLLRRLDLGEVRFDFCVNTLQEQDYDAEIASRGAALHTIASHRHSPGYFSELTRILLRKGPFDVVHCHEQLRSGSILVCAHRAGVPVRVAHSHNDTSRQDSPKNLPRWLFSVAMKRLIASHMTMGFSCSSKAAPSLFGSNWRRIARHRLLPYGFDFNHCPAPPARRELREHLGIPAGRLVIGHVGRLEIQKNHDLIIAVADQLVRSGQDVHVLLLGEGSRKAELLDHIRQRGIESRFTFAGNRGDVEALLRGAMDCFLFPSFHEGLPLALIEAQAAGLPTIFSSTVTEEVNLFPRTNQILSLDRPLGEWCDAVMEALRQGISPDVQARAESLRAGPMSIESNLHTLLACYRQGLEHA